MRYILLLLLVVSMGCQKGSDNTALNAWMGEGEKLRVLSTTAMINDLVLSVGKDEVAALTLIMGEIDPHSYELVKGDGEKFERADLIFYSGLGLEHGASVRHLLEISPVSISLGDAIASRFPEKILHVGGAIDPHLWMDISLWAEGVDDIVLALSKKRPEKASEFAARGEHLKHEMMATHFKLRDFLLQVPPENRYLVTSHDAFHYFSRAYLADKSDWEDRCAAPEGLAPEGQLSSGDIKRIVGHLCAYQIPVVFPESNVSRECLRKIVSSCASTGLKVTICEEPLYGDAMGEATSYLKMMEHNALTIKAAWEECCEKACR